MLRESVSEILERSELDTLSLTPPRGVKYKCFDFCLIAKILSCPYNYKKESFDMKLDKYLLLNLKILIVKRLDKCHH